MDGSILGQGTFTSAGSAVTIAIPSNVDFLNVWNYTQAAGSATGNGFRYYWQRGMGTNGVVMSNGAANAATVGVTSGGFTLFNPPTTPGAANNGSTGVSAWSSATPPVVTVGSTAGMSAGYVVRFYGLTGTVSSVQKLTGYNGMDFSIGYGTFNGSTTFSVDYLPALGSVSGVAGNFRVIGFPITTTNGLGIITTDGLFYPRARYITNISAATSAVITLSVQHNYKVGEQIRLRLSGGSTVWGTYAALDNYSNIINNSTSANSYTITAVDTATGNTHNTITINADTSGFGTFAFPNSNTSFTPAQVIPFGDDTATAISQNPPLSSLEDAVQNVGFIGMTLAGGTGVSAPAGQASDVIYWQAGKSTFGGL